MANPYSIGVGATGAATSFTITPGGSTGAGDVIVVAAWASTGVANVTDTQSNKYVLANTKGLLQQWVTTGKTKVIGVSDHITVTLNSSGSGNGTADGVPGAAFAGVDVQAGATGTSTSPSVTGSGGTYGGTVMSMAAIANAGSAVTWGGGFTGLGASHGASAEFLGSAWKSLTDGSASFTPSGTITSAAWITCAITLLLNNFVNNVPNAPSQFAGQLATSADMNSLASAALFARRPPFVRAQANGGQSLTGGADTAVSYNALDRDTDGFWNSTNPTRLTVQTPGIYKCLFSIPFVVGSADCQCRIRVTTGANNPAGAGVQSAWWFAYSQAANALDGTVCGGGIIPVYMYAADYIEVLAVVGTTGNMPTSPQGGIVSLRMVST